MHLKQEKVDILSLIQLMIKRCMKISMKNYLVWKYFEDEGCYRQPSLRVFIKFTIIVVKQMQYCIIMLKS